VFYLAPQLLGGPVAAVGGRGVGSNEDSARLIDVRYLRIGDDIRLSGLVAR
jgi:riboflavin biosynthesis pyrimidine reductase